MKNLLQILALVALFCANLTPLYSQASTGKKTTKTTLVKVETPEQKAVKRLKFMVSAYGKGEPKTIFYPEQGAIVTQLLSDSIQVIVETFILDLDDDTTPWDSSHILLLAQIQFSDVVMAQTEHDRLTRELGLILKDHPLKNYVDFSTISNGELASLLKELQKPTIGVVQQKEVIEDQKNVPLKSSATTQPKTKKKETFWYKTKYFFGHKLWHLREF